MNKEQILIKTSLLDLWKANSIPMKDSEIDEVLGKWTTNELIRFISIAVDMPFSEFTIEYTRSQEWTVEHLMHKETNKELKAALYKMLQHHLLEGRVSSQYLEGIEPEYLDFYSPDYGERIEDSDESL